MSKDKKYSLGLDLGIASLGFAGVELDTNDHPISLMFCSARLFDAAEEPKTGASLALPRRMARLLRRVAHRRAQRKQLLRRTLIKHGFTPEEVAAIDAHGLGEHVWGLRVKALDEHLTPEDFARVLFHLAKRRGFKSGRRHAVKEKPPEAEAVKGKKDEAKKDKTEDEKALAAMANLKKEWDASGKRTIGEYLAGLDKRRNTSGEYSHTVKREWLRQEAELIFTRQRELGNRLATEALQAAYLSEAEGAPVFYQRPLRGYADKIGKCFFYPEEDRAPKCSYTAELFVLATRIGNTRIIDGGDERSLTRLERETLEDLAHKLEKVTYTQARKALGLKEDERFNLSYPRPKAKKGKGESPDGEPTVSWKEIRDAEEKRDFIKLPGFHAIRKALDLDYKDMRARIEKEQEAFDQAAYVLSFFEEEKEMNVLLLKAGFLNHDERARLIGIENFSKTLDLSLKALRQIVPIMRLQGLRYDEACQQIGLHHSQKARANLKTLTKFPETRNPVVDRALRQARLVINAVIRRYGMPARIMVELARETGKSREKRDEIDKKIKENEAAKERNKTEAAAIGLEGSTALLKYRLWKEQGSKCAYSFEEISLALLRDPNATEIDHIIPFSKSYDDSYRNKALVLTKVNREKKNRTAMQYLKDTQGEAGCARLKAFVEERAASLGFAKKQRLLTENVDDDQWKARNLTDTSYMARLMQEHLKSCFKDVRIDTRNGALTAHLRRSWGFDEKDRSNDRHHALDAVVLACSTQSMVKKFADYNKLDNEKRRRLEGKEKRLRPPLPWETFRAEVKDAVFGKKCSKTHTRTGGIFCSRRRDPMRISGQAHEETIRSVRALSESEQVVVQRIPLIRVTDKMLERLWDVERNQDIYNVLKERLAQHGNDPKKAFKDPIYRPRRNGTEGPQIKHIRIMTDEKSGIPINGGLASNGDMLRVDVFKVKEKGKDAYYLVPIYAHHAAGKGPLPNKGCVGGKPQDEWKEMREEDFIFTLRKNDLVRVKSKTECFIGYYVGMDRATASISLRSHDGGLDASQGFDKNGIRKSIGVKTLISLQKYHVNVFGEMSGPFTEAKRYGLARGHGATGGASLAAGRADSDS